MYAPDLATECQLASGPHVRAIGWLERGQPYPTGPVDPAFLAALRAHLDDDGRFLPVLTLGPHFCDLGTCVRAGGAQHVVIPSKTCVYIAPDLVGHYVERHQYAPPREFVDAVLACPEQLSDAYVELLLPFASTWDLDEASVRHLAAQSPGRRQEAAAWRRQVDSNKGGFRW